MSLAIDDEEEQIQSGSSVFFRTIANWWQLSYPEHGRLRRAFVGIALRIALDLSFPLLIAAAIDEMMHRADKQRMIWIICAALSVKASAVLVDWLVAKRAILKAIIVLENWWPGLAHEKLLDLPTAYHEANGTGRTVAKVTKGCDRMVNITSDLFFNLFPTLTYWIFNLCVLLWIDVRIAAILILPILPALWIHGRMFKKSLPVWDEWERYKERATAHLIQGVLNIGTVQGFVTEDTEGTKQKGTRNTMHDIDWKNYQMEQWHFLAMIGLIHLGYACAVATGIFLALNQSLTLGTLAFVIATGGVTVSGFGDVIQVYRNIIRHSVAAERMKRLLAEPNPLTRNDGIRTSDLSRHELVTDQLSFCYPGKETDAVSELSLRIAPGSMVALVGRSGAGKTTLVKLLTRAYDATNGTIRIDGRDIRSIHRDEYRRLFAIVRQEVDLFDDTLRENVRYGNADASETFVEEALKAAHLWSVLADKSRFPEGAETMVGERGVRLSGGERQRVGIARAYLHLLCGARILVLDEATSNLDSEAERAIQTMINTLRHERGITIIAIAHRLSTVKAADCIYVIEKTLIEHGTHAELVRKDGIYAKLVRLQEFSDEPSSPTSAKKIPRRMTESPVV